jgi:hypothetical protein
MFILGPLFGGAVRQFVLLFWFWAKNAPSHVNAE